MTRYLHSLKISPHKILNNCEGGNDTCTLERPGSSSAQEGSTPYTKPVRGCVEKNQPFLCDSCPANVHNHDLIMRKPKLSKMLQNKRPVLCKCQGHELRKHGTLKETREA